jgi:hypothetical protein
MIGSAARLNAPVKVCAVKALLEPRMIEWQVRATFALYGLSSSPFAVEGER